MYHIYIKMNNEVIEMITTRTSLGDILYILSESSSVQQFRVYRNGNIQHNEIGYKKVDKWVDVLTFD